MSKSFTFKSKDGQPSVFSTMNPLQPDRTSVPVIITFPEYNEDSNTFIISCSDNRKRRCQLNRLAEGYAEKLFDKLQKAYDKGMVVNFVAAGGNDPDVWFYDIVKSSFSNIDNVKS